MAKISPNTKKGFLGSLLAVLKGYRVPCAKEFHVDDSHLSPNLQKVSDAICLSRDQDISSRIREVAREYMTSNRDLVKKVEEETGKKFSICQKEESNETT